ncbi:MAG TPA: FeoA family protein [Clostridia bacterium]|nr:FeoA family protein [Clostridia bacterium]
MVIAEAEADSFVIIDSIHSGRNLKMRLYNMGLTPGVKVKVISSEPGSAIVISVRGSRLVLGKGISEKIEVRNSGE